MQEGTRFAEVRQLASPSGCPRSLLFARCCLLLLLVLFACWQRQLCPRLFHLPVLHAADIAGCCRSCWLLALLLPSLTHAPSPTRVRDTGAEPVVFNLDDRNSGGKFKRAALGRITGKYSLPSCWVNGRYVGGFDDGPSADAPGLVKLSFQGRLGNDIRGGLMAGGGNQPYAMDYPSGQFGGSGPGGLNQQFGSGPNQQGQFPPSNGGGFN